MKLYELTEREMRHVWNLAFWAAGDPESPYYESDFAEKIMHERDAQELAAGAWVCTVSVRGEKVPLSDFD